MMQNRVTMSVPGIKAKAGGQVKTECLVQTLCSLC
jgi:hypothetical protein